jgi:hypothetical protein
MSIEMGKEQNSVGEKETSSLNILRLLPQEKKQ